MCRVELPLHVVQVVLKVWMDFLKKNINFIALNSNTSPIIVHSLIEIYMYQFENVIDKVNLVAKHIL